MILAPMSDAPANPRIALLVDSLNARARRSRHPEFLARGLASRGWTAEVVPVTAGLLGRVPRDVAGPAPTAGNVSASAASGASGALAAASPASGEPAAVPTRERVESADVLVAYDAASPAAWLAARLARTYDRPMAIVEPAWFSMRAWHERLRVRAGLLVWGRLVRSRVRLAVGVDPVALERLAQYGYRSDETHFIPSAADTDLFRPGVTSRLAARLHLSGRFVLYVGHLEEGRGVETLVQAFARSVGQRGDWSLVLVGSGSLHARIEALANRLGVWANVRILPVPALDDLAGLFSAATLFAAPAEDDRVRGRNLTQAIAAGLPVVASDLPRMRVRVEHDRNGLLVPPGDAAALAAALTQAAIDPNLRQRWRGESRRIAVERFSIPVMAARFDELLRGLL
jgi:glycosyltransferase involved in cell wall biosynthesis